eukprot:XP_008767330.1 PREDICTED: arf-GAP domain and FG repeat-containing protein 2-like [Rattus norvegicus]
MALPRSLQGTSPPTIGTRRRPGPAQRVQRVPHLSSFHPHPTSVSSSALSLRSQPSLLVLSYPGSSQMSAFGVAPLAAASQPNSLADVGGLLEPRMAAGGLPGSVFGMPSQVPALQSAVPGVGGSTGLPFGAFTNPFTTPAQPQLPSTNPFQPNGIASGKSPEPILRSLEYWLSSTYVSH